MMHITGVYMKNDLTLRIRKKGYTLKEFLDEIGFSLRWYRMHEKVGSKRYEFLSRKVDELINKGE